MMRRGPLLLIALAAALGAGACVIIVEPGGDDPVPVPVPLVCTNDPSVPTVHVYFSARVERSTVNLAGHYARFMTDTVMGLAGAGIQTTQALLVRADERPAKNRLLGAWGCRLDSPETLRPEAVIRWYAVNEDLEPSLWAASPTPWWTSPPP